MESILKLEIARPPKRASLLGIPRELRLAIYTHVYSADLNTEVVEVWKDLFIGGYKCVPKLSECPLRIPWVRLMLTCKTIAIELRSVFTSHSFHESEENTTYSLGLQATQGGSFLGATTWTKLPCAPHQARFVNVRYNASTGFRSWGNGGPNSIVRGLFQTMNHLVHCGPRFDSRHLLDTPMKIEDLLIKIELGPAPAETRKRTEAEWEKEAEITLYEMGSHMGQINRTGILKGFIDNVRMEFGDKTLHWSPQSVDDGDGVPSEWIGYGFDWGVTAPEKPEQDKRSA